MAISVVEYQAFTARTNVSALNEFDAGGLPAGAESIVLVITIYDTSSTDSIVSNVKLTGNNRPFTYVTNYYDTTSGGHIWIWYIGGGHDELVANYNATLGGTCTDVQSAFIYLNEDCETDVVATAAYGTEPGAHMGVTWTTSAAETVCVAGGLNDESVGTNITLDAGTSVYIEDVGSDTVVAAYVVKSSSGSVTLEWTNSGNDQDWVATGASFKKNYNPKSSKPAYLSGAVGELFHITHEAGNLNEWDAVNGGTIAATTDSALVGTYGMKAYADGIDTDDDVEMDTSWPSSRSDRFLSVRFLFDPNSIGLSSGEAHDIFRFNASASPTTPFVMQLQYYDGSSYYIDWYYSTPTTTNPAGGAVVVSDAPFIVEARIRRESVYGAGDGQIDWWVNGVQQTSTTSVRWDATFYNNINGFQAGIVNQNASTATGYVFMDDVVIRDDAQYIGWDNTPASDSQSAYLEGQSLASQSDNQIAYTRGSLDATPDTQSAYMHGAVATTSTKSCFTMGMEAGFSLYFRDDFETNDFSAWTSTTGAQLTTSTQSAMSGTYGMQTEIDDADLLYAYLNTNDNISEVIIEFLFDPNDVSEHDFGWNYLLWGNMPTYTGFGNKKVIELEFTDSTSGPPQLRYVIYDDDDGDGWYTNYHTINQGPNKIRLHWTGTSSWAIYLNDTLAQSGTTTHGKRRLEEFRFGLTSGGSNQGTMYFDQFWMFVKYADSDNQPAYLRGAVATSDNQIAFLAGSLDDSDTQLAYLAGSLDDLDNQSAYTAGQDTATDNQAAYTQGSLDTSAVVSGYLQGSQDGSASLLGYVAGQDVALASSNAYTKGQDTFSGSSSGYLSGQDSLTDNKPAYLVGSTDTQDNFAAFLAGGIETSDNQIAYLEGGVIFASDSKLAYTSGLDNTLDTQAAFLAGSLDDLDNQIAYTTGQDNVLATEWAYTRGQSSTTDNKAGYLAGKDTASDNTPAYTQGSIDVTDNQVSYTIGQDNSLDSIPAFLVGGIEVSDSQIACLVGSDDALATQWAFMAGGVEDSASLPVYIHGKDDALATQWAYSQGSIDTSDSTSGYLQGSQDTQDTKSAYTHGQSAQTDNIPGYILGGVGVADNISAYMLAIGEWLIPEGDIANSTQWKREDESTSNLYVSIDEDNASDSDYVYHADVAGTEYFEVYLTDPSGGTVGEGDVTIWWRGKIAGTGTVTMRVLLLEGTTTIAQSDEVFTTGYVTYTYTLTGGEKSSITDWTNLRLRFIVQGVV